METKKTNETYEATKTLPVICSKDKPQLLYVDAFNQNKVYVQFTKYRTSNTTFCMPSFLCFHKTELDESFVTEFFVHDFEKKEHIIQTLSWAQLENFFFGLLGHKDWIDLNGKSLSDFFDGIKCTKLKSKTGPIYICGNFTASRYYSSNPYMIGVLEHDLTVYELTINRVKEDTFRVVSQKYVIDEHKVRELCFLRAHKTQKELKL